MALDIAGVADHCCIDEMVAISQPSATPKYVRVSGTSYVLRSVMDAISIIVADIAIAIVDSIPFRSPSSVIN